MYNPLIGAYFRYCKMVTETVVVLNHRLPILNNIVSNPFAAYNPLNWLEVNRMVGEKMLAFGQANLVVAMNVMQLPYGRTLSAREILRIQQKALVPVSRALTANARRIRRTPKSR